MIDIPHEALKLIENKSLSSKLIISFKNKDIPSITNDKIRYESLTLTESICSSDFAFGGGELSQIEFDVYDIDNITGEKINVELRIILGPEYDGEMQYINRDEDGNYYLFINLGEYVVDDCKMKASTSTFNQRRVIAFSNEAIRPIISRQIDLLNNSGIETMYVSSTQLLDANDDYDLNYLTSKSVPHDMRSVVATYSQTVVEDDHVYEIRFDFTYDAAFYQAARTGIVRLGGELDYVSDSKKAEFRELLDELFTVFDTEHRDIKNRIYADFVEALEEINKNLCYKEPFHNIAFRNNDFRYKYFPTDVGPWKNVEIIIYDERGSEVDSKTLDFGYFDISEYQNYGGDTFRVPYYLSVPLDHYEDWFKRLRKSSYEVIGRLAQARNKYMPVTLDTSGLQPHNGLYPHDGLYPQGSAKNIETNLIKDFWVEDFGKRFGAIQFNWVDHVKENQTATIPMLKNPEQYEALKLKEMKWNEDYTYDARATYYGFKFKQKLTTNHFYLDLEMKTFMSVMIEFWRDTGYEKIRLFEAVCNFGNRSGYSDEDEDLDEHDYREMTSDYIKGHIINDKLIGANMMVIKPLDDTVHIIDTDFQLNKMGYYEYDYSYGDGLEYCEGDTYVVSEDNLIMSDAKLSSMAIKYFADRMEQQLRDFAYYPIELSMKALPFLQPGDCIEVHTPVNNTKTYIMRRTMKGIQSISDTIEAF